ncbi:MAG: hypothetical protein ABL971_09710 [Vicinamibacterales bacterium]
MGYYTEGQGARGKPKEEGQMTEPTRLGFQSQVIETYWRHLRIKVED